MHAHAVKASQPAPPASPVEADCYRVTAPATGAWASREDSIAVAIAGDWHFVAPRHGMAIFDRAGDCLLVFRSGWQRAQAPAAPTGGAVVDAEARASLTALIAALKAVGILAAASP
ncbi:DUF2793 domain-containing protein [Erythrobacter sp. NE805]|uniref:DUF2793 domain-containing protein n=1 Tax=Erythrobacter sp. NE805 TaxID=3389875 RepID=UPI00396B34DF